MKTIIVAIALFLPLMFFPLQSTLDELNHYRRQTLNNVIESYAQQARKEGYFTPTIITDLKNDISTQLDIPVAEIIVDATTTPRYKTLTFEPNELIYYKVSVPIDEIMAMSQIFKIDPADNSYTHVVEDYVSSERLP